MTIASAATGAEFDVVVVGSGAAALVAALTASAGGLSCAILEKTEWLGGTSAMSGGAAWLPANHLAAAEGIEDSPEDALEYLRATAPAGWRETEDPLWRSFAENAGPMLRFVEEHCPVRFELTSEPDVYAEAAGARSYGRMTAPKHLPKAIAGPFARRIRPSTLPHIFSYRETIEADLYRKPLQAAITMAPRLLGRVLSGSAAKGTALTAGLIRGCLDYGCSVLPGARATELIPDGAGAGVSGLMVDINGKRLELMARRGIVLATGGFEWDQELLGQHFPGGIDRIGSSPGNEGDAIRMARAVGAALAHMDQALIYPCVPTIYEGRVHGMPVAIHMEPYAIVVDRTGRRFTSEYAVDLGEALDRRDPASGHPIHLPAWLISDRRFLRPALRWYARNDPGWIRGAPTIEGLARQISLPAGALAETVRRFNGFCVAGRDADFGRGETVFQKAKTKSRPVMLPIEAAPFVALPFGRSVLSTKGGLRTNEHAEVLRTDGSVIAGLYCCGAAMANPIGTRAISAGTTIGPNMTWGYIAGRRLRTGNRTGRAGGGAAGRSL